MKMKNSFGGGFSSGKLMSKLTSVTSLKNVKKDKKVSIFLEKKSVFKHIIVKNKLINFIVK